MTEFTKAVTRFAPSPTGFMHIGNLRTALYSYLIAKSSGGKFILRIEDTDQKRQVEGAVEVILSTLDKTGLIFDEGPGKDGGHGPYVQSERKPIYMEYAKKLIDLGGAYYCFCTEERLNAIRDEAKGAGYDRHCRNLSQEEIEDNLAKGIPYVIRQKMPLSGTTTYEDSVFGTISIENDQLQDQILIKQDGFPTYNFAHVIDDYLMGVTHVVRGSEYVTSTPKYVLLYDTFGWERPTYVHLPLIMGQDAEGNISKLSKRHGAVSFENLVEMGYLPEAVVNYIALLGWSPKGSTEEFFTLKELEELFSVAGINNSPSVFDYGKLLWFNGEYIRKMSEEDFLEKAKPYIDEALPTVENRYKTAPLLQPRIGTFCDIKEMVGFLEKLPEYDESIYTNKKNKTTPELCKQIIADLIPCIENEQVFCSDTLFAIMKDYAAEKGIKVGAVAWALRIAVTGLSVTPGGATELMEILGKEESILRLKKAIANA